jgi:hypothetical protein
MTSMLDGVMPLWFVLAGAAFLFVAVDIRNTLVMGFRAAHRLHWRHRRVPLRAGPPSIRSICGPRTPKQNPL